jgi:hypothetical protein
MPWRAYKAAVGEKHYFETLGLYPHPPRRIRCKMVYFSLDKHFINSDSDKGFLPDDYYEFEEVILRPRSFSKFNCSIGTL